MKLEDILLEILFQEGEYWAKWNRREPGVHNHESQRALGQFLAYAKLAQLILNEEVESVELEPGLREIIGVRKKSTPNPYEVAK